LNGEKLFPNLFDAIDQLPDVGRRFGDSSHIALYNSSLTITTSVR
jgi:hypothetical protein